MSISTLTDSETTLAPVSDSILESPGTVVLGVPRRGVAALQTRSLGTVSAGG